MKKHKLKDGWTKDKVMAQFKEKNNGTRAMIITDEDDLGCAYRGVNGNACAAGAFIPDKLYRKDMEDVPIATVLRKYPRVEKYMPLDSRGMECMQSVHDSCNQEGGTNGDTYQAIQNFLDNEVE